MGNAGVRMEQRSYCRNLPVIPSRLSLLGRAMTRTFLFTALNVQRSCSGETDAHVDQVSEVWKLEGDADGSVRWVVLDRSHDDRPHCSG